MPLPDNAVGKCCRRCARPRDDILQQDDACADSRAPQTTLRRCGRAAGAEQGRGQQAHRPADRPAARRHENLGWHHEPAGQLRQMDEKKRQDKAQIAELIGPDKAKTLEEYQRSMPARQELEMLARQLDGADTPLNDDQQKRLLAVITEERKRTPSPTMSDGTSVEDFAKAYMKWQADYERERGLAGARRPQHATSSPRTTNTRNGRRQMRIANGRRARRIHRDVRTAPHPRSAWTWPSHRHRQGDAAQMISANSRSAIRIESAGR